MEAPGVRGVMHGVAVRGQAPADGGRATLSGGTFAKGAKGSHSHSSTAHGAPLVVIMGVSGAGKTTIGSRLAQELRCSFLDADDFHSQSNREKMRRGVALTDQDRGPWLEALAQAVHRWRHAQPAHPAQTPLVLACSALRPPYRDTLRHAAAGPCPLLATEAASPGAAGVHPSNPLAVPACAQHPSVDAGKVQHPSGPSSAGKVYRGADKGPGRAQEPQGIAQCSGQSQDMRREEDEPQETADTAAPSLESTRVPRTGGSPGETEDPVSLLDPGKPTVDSNSTNNNSVNNSTDNRDSVSNNNSGCGPRAHWFVLLEGPPEVFAARVSARQASGAHFMPASLIQSQFSALEIGPQETDVERVDATESPESIVKHIAGTVLSTSQVL